MLPGIKKLGLMIVGKNSWTTVAFINKHEGLVFDDILTFVNINSDEQLNRENPKEAVSVSKIM